MRPARVTARPTPDEFGVLTFQSWQTASATIGSSDVKLIKADGVPLVITIFAILMGLGGTVIGVGALIDPTTAIEFVDGSDKLATSWAGRNLGLGVAMLAAVLLRHPAGYAVVFAGAIWREFSDVLAGTLDGGSFNVPFALVLVIEAVCLAICVRATLAARSVAVHSS